MITGIYIVDSLTWENLLVIILLADIRIVL